MSKTELKLMKDDWNENYLQIVYDEEDRLNDDIYLMNPEQMANYLYENIDVANYLYGGDDRGNPLSIETDVCYLPNCGETFITTHDYGLLDHNDLLEEAAEMVSSLKGGN